MNGEIFCIAYASSIIGCMDDVDIELLLRISRERNQRKHITGLLLYCERSFFQLLEGEEETVEDVFAKIASDRRHNHVTRLFTARVQKRAFENWNMGFRKADKDALMKTSPELFEMLWETKAGENCLGPADPRVTHLLLSFCKAVGLGENEKSKLEESHAPWEESVNPPSAESA